MNQAQDYLSLQHISKSFGSFSALRDISLSVSKGEFICFLGPSGCGKTTLLRIIAGLESQNQGEIRQAGHNISWAPASKRDYGIVFQSYALFPNLSIAQNIAYGLVNRHQPKSKIAERVQELLNLVGLPTSGEKYPGQLSGGQQQRIALARALATSPGLLLLDEPLSALDALERVRLRSEIRQLQQRLGITTIMVTHDQEEALSMADRIVVMNHGVIEQIGTPREIYLKPGSPFVASFIGKVNAISGLCLGAGKFRFGETEFFCANASPEIQAGQPVKIYVRPEELTHRDMAAATPYDAVVVVKKLEFLGAASMLTATLEGDEQQDIHISLPLADIERLQLGVGSRARFGIQAERVQIFADTAPPAVFADSAAMINGTQTVAA